MFFRTVLMTASIAALFVQTSAADDWPRYRGEKDDGIWREKGVVRQLDPAHFKIKWSVPLGSGYTGPTVADGRLYVMDYASDPEETERVLCFDAQNGKPIWKYDYPVDYADLQYKAGPRASVTIDEDRAYALGAVGNFYCFDAKEGRVLWEKNLRKDFIAPLPVWGFASHPLIEGDMVIILAGAPHGACVLAFDKKSGNLLWKSQDDAISYSWPIALDQAGKRIIVCRTNSRIIGLNVTDGALLWEYPYKLTRWSDAIIAPVPHKDQLYVSSFNEGSLMLRLATDECKVEKVWEKKGKDEVKTESLHILMASPIVTDEYIYGVDSHGQFRCIDATNGERIWEDKTLCFQGRWGTLHMVEEGDRVWMFNDQGQLYLTKLSKSGCDKMGQVPLIKTTTAQLSRGTGVTWTHPAFANRCIFIRNDEELVCGSLEEKDSK